MQKKVKKRTNKAIKKTKWTKQDKTLISTFIILIILVIVLAAIALNMKNFRKEAKANIVIPILETNSQNEIGVDVSDMKKGDTKEYVFKVSNYKGNKLIKENITYDIDITSSQNTTIKLYKNEANKNLIKNDDYLIEENILPKNKKTTDEYRLIIEAISNPEKSAKITLNINS